MKLILTPAEKMLAAFLAFTVCLLGVRVAYTGTVMYMFYPWNLLLAIVPLFLSRRLRGSKHITIASIFICALWLLFFPNAPYLITDIFHFEKRPGVPQWFDLLLVLSAAWCGLLAGFISLNDVEKFLAAYSPRRWHWPLTVFLLFAASFGIYLGRYLRFNSWDIVTKPFAVAHAGFLFTFRPHEHIQGWSFCLACTAFLLLAYASIKKAVTQ